MFCDIYQTLMWRCSVRYESLGSEKKSQRYTCVSLTSRRSVNIVSVYDYIGVKYELSARNT